jgi:Tfp pilus assembly protein PilX
LALTLNDPRRPLLEAVRRRQRERGAALFLVVLVLTIVTAIGVFSMRSASLVDVATGYDRQSVQATLMAEYGARAAATYLERNPSLVSGTTRVPGCATALQTIDLSAPCTVFKTSLIAESLEDTAPGGAPAEGVNGQLSSPHDPTNIDAEFVTEMTEPTMASVASSPGFTSGLFKQVTFTTIARVFPTQDLTTGVCSTAARGSVSQQTVRSHVIVPM